MIGIFQRWLTHSMALERIRIKWEMTSSVNIEIKISYQLPLSAASFSLLPAQRRMLGWCWRRWICILISIFVVSRNGSSTGYILQANMKSCHIRSPSSSAICWRYEKKKYLVPSYERRDIKKKHLILHLLHNSLRKGNSTSPTLFFLNIKKQVWMPKYHNTS